MKLNKISTAAVALSFAALLGTTAQATPPVPTDGDLILSFEEPSVTTNSNVYEVDLGSATAFLNPTSPTLSFSLSDTDLDGLFGSNWASNSAVQFGVIGGNTSGGDETLGTTNVASDELFLSWNQWATAPKAKSGSSTDLTSAYVGDLYNDLTSVTRSTNSNALWAVSTTKTDADGTAYLAASKSNFNLGTGSSKSILDFNSDGTTSAPNTATLNLYAVTPTDTDIGTKGDALLGTFSVQDVNSQGVLTFTATTVPEPSTYLMMAAGGLMLIWRLRRNASVQA